MNRCFRVIWNKARHAWVVTCEFAHGNRKPGQAIRVVGSSLALGLAVFADAPATLASAVEEEEAKSLAWVAQMYAANYSVQPRALGAGSFAYAAGGATADGAASVALGQDARVEAGANDAIAIGNNARVTGNSYRSIAIGYDAVVDSATLGTGHQSSSSIALGDRSRIGANTWDSIAIGYGAEVADSADYGVTLGSYARVQSKAGQAMALGQRATALHANSVALGAYTSTDRVNSVAVGGRQLTQLAAGRQATDAVNMGQLDSLAANLDVVDSSGTRYFKANSTGNVASATGSNAIAIGQAASASAIESLATGVSAQAAGMRSTSLGAASTAGGNRGTALGHQASAFGDFGTALGALARVGATSINSVALGFNASATRSNSVALGANSTTDRADSVSVGNATSRRQITNVAAGTQDNDAVNLLQLKQARQSLADVAASALLWDSSLGAFNARRGDTTGKITGVAAGDISANSADVVVGAQLHQTNARVGALESGMSSSGLSSYFKANSSNSEATATGEDAVSAGPAANASGMSSVAIGDRAHATGTQSTAIGANATAGHANAIALGAGSKSERDNSLSIGSAGHERQITNVAAGTADTDAVNVAQLRDASTGSAAAVARVGDKVDAVDARVSQVSGDVENLRQGTDGMLQTNNNASLPKPKASGSNALAGGAAAVASGADSSALGNRAQASGDGSVALGAAAQAKGSNSVALGANSVAERNDSVSVGSAGASRQVTHVAAGTQALDAVNLEQLNTGLNGAKAYTDTAFRSLRKDIQQLDDELSAGIAGAMAMAALPQPHTPGASMTPVGVGNFRGESTIAVGVSNLSKDGKWVTKLQGSSDTRGDVGVSLGLGYQWD